ncbi:hypothetical protein DFH29DRAFT_1003411 [Suillus ampliporus]|nr:hypothetical protein DFH29DRAFT_1003411 [Suillus ampliporus]
MSKAQTIPPTIHREEYIPPQVRCFPIFPSPMSYKPSSQMSLSQQPAAERVSVLPQANRFTSWSKATTEPSTSNEPMSTTSSNAAAKSSSKLPKSSKLKINHLENEVNNDGFTLAAYTHDLAPKPSPLRPPCPAKDRLYLWTPTTSRTSLDAHGKMVSLSPADLKHIKDVVIQGYADSTRESYGSGLLVCGYEASSERDLREEVKILFGLTTR